MASAIFRIAALWALGAFLPRAFAGFDPGASNNIAIYWGQNSINRAGGQQRLATYCSNSPVNIIPLAFLHVIKNPTSLNFANAGDNCTTFEGTQLLRCPEIEEDIQFCQSLNKTILLSIGGATYTEGGFASPEEAITWANRLWAMFGPPPAAPPSADILRPFGSAVIDGFDMDFEATSSNMEPFAAALRRLMDDSAAGETPSRRYLLSAAPQCPFPDHAMGAMLDAVGFDFVAVQFYNNYCGAPSYVPGAPAQNNFNFGTWDQWARTASVNRKVKVLLGLPASPSAAGTGYVSGEQLRQVIAYARGYGSFGGVMAWWLMFGDRDMSQAYGNPGFLEGIRSALGVPLPPITTVTTTSTRTSQVPTTTLSTSTVTLTKTTSTNGPTPTGPLVPQWGQCGGMGYNGPTQCQPPFTCVYLGDWWSHCA
ncbi:carbohydrate-binding module family 1 protein [Canariomyces notabilis]|uniref:chitinase n=1 Tax=Canariomyces notabilis TaxID=2074819 RepID=A0AAN6QF77_9PEZI|nr:carbohydrate-binding module family 1 protein [Canariomyces arenarius]